MHDKYELLIMKHILFRIVEIFHFTYVGFASRRTPDIEIFSFIFWNNETSTPKLSKTLKIVRIDPLVLPGDQFEVGAIILVFTFSTFWDLKILGFCEDPESWWGKKKAEKKRKILQMFQFWFGQNFGCSGRIIEFLSVLESRGNSVFIFSTFKIYMTSCHVAFLFRNV